MPKYISLVSFTEEGFKNLKDTRKRADAFAEAAKKKQVIFECTFWTIGKYDIVHVFSAPDDETAASVAFALGTLGHVRTTTMRAFDKDEMENVLAHAYDLKSEQGSLT